MYVYVDKSNQRVVFNSDRLITYLDGLADQIQAVEIATPASSLGFTYMKRTTFVLANGLLVSTPTFASPEEKAATVLLAWKCHALLHLTRRVNRVRRAAAAGTGATDQYTLYRLKRQEAETFLALTVAPVESEFPLLSSLATSRGITLEQAAALILQKSKEASALLTKTEVMREQYRAKILAAVTSEAVSALVQEITAATV